jgi:hypothetical protein
MVGSETKEDGMACVYGYNNFFEDAVVVITLLGWVCG